MNYASLTDFTKYTLAAAAASYFYAYEKIVISSSHLRVAVILILIVLTVSLLTGVLLYASIVKAQHFQSPRDDDKIKTIDLNIARLGTVHAASLFLAVFGIAIVQISTVYQKAPVAV
jgi:hypothetical protein